MLLLPLRFALYVWIIPRVLRNVSCNQRWTFCASRQRIVYISFLILDVEVQPCIVDYVLASEPLSLMCIFKVIIDKIEEIHFWFQLSYDKNSWRFFFVHRFVPLYCDRYSYYIMQNARNLTVKCLWSNGYKKKNSVSNLFCLLIFDLMLFFFYIFSISFYRNYFWVFSFSIL